MFQIALNYRCSILQYSTVTVFCPESVNYIQSESGTLEDFLLKTAAEIHASCEDGSLEEVFTPVLDVIRQRFMSDFTLMHPEVNKFIKFTMFFTKSAPLAEVGQLEQYGVICKEEKINIT